jgi:hypothetical protein
VRNVQRAPQQAQLTDAQLENAIANAYQLLVGAPQKRRKIVAWRQLRRLIQSRSPNAVARLEAKRGLAVRS